METELNKALSWEIDNSCERIKSEPFSSCGSDWYVVVYPKGYPGCDEFSMFLNVVHPESAGPGWKRRARFCFVLLNQSRKELCRSPGNELDIMFHLLYLINEDD